MSSQPRNSKPAGKALSNAQAIMLRQHPEAFDCIIYKAKKPKHDEIISDAPPIATLLDSDERTQEYYPPVLERAMQVPTQELDFGPTSSGDYENFNSATDAIYLLLSINVRPYSFIKWYEYATADADSEVLERAVYVAEIRPQGRTLGAGNVYVCYPLPDIDGLPYHGELADSNGERPPKGVKEDAKDGLNLSPEEQANIEADLPTFLEYIVRKRLEGDMEEADSIISLVAVLANKSQEELEQLIKDNKIEEKVKNTPTIGEL